MIKIIFWIIITYFAFVAALYLIQRSMIYFPSKQVESLPTIAAVERLAVTTTDNINLSGWHVAPQEAKPVIVFFHGNASRHSESFYRIFPFIEDGYGFLSIGYRGYGGNDGKPSEQGFYNDARAFITALKEKGINEDQIILYGQSIGTGPAIQMATEFKNIRAVVLESPYTALPDVAAKTYFFVPVHLLMKDKFDNLSKISDVTAPLLIIHGKNDRIIPFHFGQTLFEAANDPKKLIALDNIGHNNIPTHDLKDDIVEFLKAN